MMDRIIVVLVIGTVGGMLAKYAKMPGGSLLGAMFATGVFSLLVADPEPLPEGFRTAALLFLGVSIGSSVDRDVLWQIRRALVSAMGAILILIATGFGLGWALYRFAPTDLPMVTILLGCMPGGASGMAAMAGDLGGDVRLVASLHMVRQIMVFGILPFVLRWLVGRPPQAGAK
jgi:membrane AbrB-like protein